MTFPLICTLSVVGCLLGTFLTQPTEEPVLASFFRKVRPFGRWGRIRRQVNLSPAELKAPGEGAGLAVLNVVLASTAVIGIYLFPMYLVGHWHGYALLSLGVAVLGPAALFLTWYRRLPPPETDAQ